MNENITKAFHVPLFYLLVFSLPFIGYAPLNIYGGIQMSYILGLMILSILVTSNLIFNGKIRFFKQLSSRILFFWVFIAILASLILSLAVPEEFSKYYAGEQQPLTRSIKMIFRLFMVISVYLVSLQIMRDEKIFRKTMRFLIYGGLFSSVYGLYQAVAYKLNLPFTDLFCNNISFLGRGTPTVYPWGWAGMLRIGSTAYEPCIFADFLLVIIPMYGFVILNNQRVLKTRLRDIIAFSFIFLAFTLTFSRAGWIALSFGFFLLIVYLVKKKNLLSASKKVFPAIIAIGFFLFLMFGVTFGRIDVKKRFLSRFNFIASALSGELTKGQDYTFDHKVTSYGVAANIIKKHPLFGVGLGNYGFYYESNLPRWGSDYLMTKGTRGMWANPKGIYMQILTDTGIIGFFIFSLFIIVTLKKNARLTKEADSDYMKTVAIGLRLSFFTLLIQGLSFSGLYFSHWWFLLAAMAAGSGNNTLKVS